MALTAPAEVPVMIGKRTGRAAPQQLRDALEHADLVGGARAAARQHQAERRRLVADAARASSRGAAESRLVS